METQNNDFDNDKDKIQIQDNYNPKEMEVIMIDQPTLKKDVSNKILDLVPKLNFSNIT